MNRNDFAVLIGNVEEILCNRKSNSAYLRLAFKPFGTLARDSRNVECVAKSSINLTTNQT